MRDVVVRYGASTAVAGVNLDIAPGEVLGLLGPSGCGKSSLLRAIAGLEPVASGTVAWDGQDLAATPVHRRGFGLMFQDGQLFSHRDVFGNVAYGLTGLTRQARRERVRDLLAVVGLSGYDRRPVVTLSGGEKQRVALARSLAPAPRVLLLDEPLSALDRGLRERLAADLRAALVATKTTAVFVTHDHDEAFTVADRVAVMSEGRILQVASPEVLWRTPASATVARFLGYQAFIPLPAGATGETGPVLAVGPRGVLAGNAGDPPSDGGRAHGRGVRANGDEAARRAGQDGGFPGVVVSSVFRGGSTEVTVDAVVPVAAALRAAGMDAGAPDTRGLRTAATTVKPGRVPSVEASRLVAVTASPGDSRPRLTWVPGTRVILHLDAAGCVVVGGRGGASGSSVRE